VGRWERAGLWLRRHPKKVVVLVLGALVVAQAVVIGLLLLRYTR
jgi:hypothetical protein